MATELTLDALEGMKKADFMKAFKNKAAWKKAKAVIVMVDYLLDGKKATIAIPYKREADMKKDIKRIKAEKTHNFKKTGGGSFAMVTENGTSSAKIDFTEGSLKAALFEKKGSVLFGTIKLALQLAQEQAEQVLNTQEEQPNNNTPKEVFDTTNNNTAPDQKKKKVLTPEQKAKKVENLRKISANLDKMLSKLIK